MTRWAYGITTVPERRLDLVPRTMLSLIHGGFHTPHIFVDGVAEYPKCPACQLTTRSKPLRTFGHWALSMAELWIRNPACDRYAMFQDDFVCVRNLRQYLDRVEYPSKGYLNLLTFPSNETFLEEQGNETANRIGFHESRETNPGSSWQTGRGAVALVFSREALMVLLTSRTFVERPMDATQGHKRLDGCIVTAMNKAGWREYIHNPSLVLHTGKRSSMGNKPHPHSKTFPGEEYDALDLLSANVPPHRAVMVGRVGTGASAVV